MRFTILALFATVCAAENETKEDLYKEFSDDMLFWGYTWEPIKITTDDGYVLTTFRITGRTGHEMELDESLNPVILMHGLSCDATSWVAVGEKSLEPPLPLRLFNRGFDVYMAANRGTKYCQEHESLKTTDAAFWDWTWTQMGTQDDVANLKMVKERTGKKSSYIGVSQGTIQMFYALSTQEDLMKEYVYTFAAMDPCTIAVNEGTHIYKDGLMHF